MHEISEPSSCQIESELAVIIVFPVPLKYRTYSPPFDSAERVLSPFQTVQVPSEAKYSSVPSHIFLLNFIDRVKPLEELNVK